MKRKLLSFFLALLFVCLLPACARGRTSGFESPNPGSVFESSSTPDASSEEKEETNLNDLMRSMKASPYRDDSLHTGKYGLTSPEAVGVDEETFAGEIRYPVAPDSEFSSRAVFAVSAGEGIAGLRRAMAAAQSVNAAGEKAKIKLPAGEFRLSMEDISAAETYLLHFEDFDGLHIEGKNTTLVMENDGSQWVGFIEFSRCKNVYMQDVALDYAVPPVMTGEIISVDTEKKEAKLSLLDEFLPAWKNYGNLPLRSYVETGDDKAPFPGGNYIYSDGGNGDISSAFIEGSVMTVRFGPGVTLHNSPVGTKTSLAVTMYGNNAINFHECENAHLETVRVYTCPGMGITAMKCKNLYWNRANLMLKPGSGRLMTATADAMHLTSCTGDVFISNSLVENTHDDGINIKAGFYMTVASVAYNTGRVMLDGYSDENLPPRAGDTIEAYTPALRCVASLTVKSVRTTAGKYEVFFEEDVYDLEAGLYAVNVSHTPRFVYENNIVRNKRNRGMLIQVRGAIIRNCTFSDIAHGAVNVYTELATGAREAMMPRDITFENCKFLSGYEGYVSPFTLILYGSNWESTPDVIREIRVRNCFIAESGGRAIEFLSGTDCAIEHNFFYGEKADFIAAAFNENTGNRFADNYASVAALWTGNGKNTAADNENISYRG